jgi:hypothetical protein
MVIPPSNEVVSEVVSPSKPCPTIISSTLIPPDTTFLLKDYFKNNVDAEADISIRNQKPNTNTPSKGGNIGGITCSDDSQNLLGQGLGGDTTSPERGGITSLKLEKVTDEDAQAMRNIAVDFWPEYYPEQIQSLITQMYGWQAPGTKYDDAILTEWLQGEEDVIRDHLTELIRLRKG